MYFILMQPWLSNYAILTDFTSVQRFFYIDPEVFDAQMFLDVDCEIQVNSSFETQRIFRNTSCLNTHCTMLVLLNGWYYFNEFYKKYAYGKSV